MRTLRAFRTACLLLALASAVSLADDTVAPDPAGQQPAAPPPAGFLAKGTKPLEGVWVTGEFAGTGKRVRLEVSPQGLVTLSGVVDGVETKLLAGHGAYEDGVLRVWVADVEPTMATFRCKFTGEFLELTEEPGGTLRLARVGMDGTSAAVEQLDRETRILGTWESVEPEVIRMYTLQPGGKYTRLLLWKVGGLGGDVGSYRIDGSRILWREADGDGVEVAQTFRLADTDTLEIDESDQYVVRLFRQGVDSTPGGPPALAGIWLAENAEAPVRLTFRPDGTMEEEAVHADGPLTFTGRYKATSDTLVIRLAGLPEGRVPLAMPDENSLVLGGERGVTYRRIGDAARAQGERTIVGTWEVEDEGVRIVFTLAGDETCVVVVTDKEGTRETPGTYETEEDTLTVRLGPEEVLRFEIRVLTDERLVLVEPDGDVSVLKRRGTPVRGVFGTRPGPRMEGTDAARIRGEWLMRSAAVEIRLTFCANGSYWEVVRTAEGTGESQGRYVVADDVMTAYPEAVAETIRLTFVLLDDDTLELRDEHGTGYRLERQR